MLLFLEDEFKNKSDHPFAFFQKNEIMGFSHLKV